MITSRENIKKAVKICISDLVSEFQRQPYAFLFESDLQAKLYTNLCSCIPEPVEVPGTGRPENNYKTAIVHTEYWKRIDIVCLDPESKQWSKTRIHKGSDVHIYELPILVGMELKYSKMGDFFGVSECLADFDKLRSTEIQFPVVLGFLQNRSYEDYFFDGIPFQLSRTEVSDIDPFRAVHVISPGKIWKVDIQSTDRK